MARSIADQETTAQLEDEEAFPHLGTRDSFSIESPFDEAYNCIAYAAGDARIYWWPLGEARSGDVYWPDDAPNEETLEAFEAAFASLGYEPCDSDEFEEEYEKIALYADQNVPTHATRQDPTTGNWVSKLGDHVDIWHQRVDSLEGELYGNVCRYMKRRLQPNS